MVYLCTEIEDSSLDSILEMRRKTKTVNTKVVWVE